MATAKTKRRNWTEHPGVKMLRRERERGDVWLGRWIDPETGKWVEQSLTKLALTSREQRVKWAKKKSREIRKRREELRRVEAGVRTPKAMEIAEAVPDYLNRAGERLNKLTIDGYSSSLARFFSWSEEHGPTKLKDVTPEVLSEFKDWLSRQRKRVPRKKGGRGDHKKTNARRATSSINHDLKRLRVFFHEARRLGRVPHLDRDAITDRLSGLTAERPRPSFLRPNELKKLLRACLRHDKDTYQLTRAEKDGDREVGTTPKNDPVAPFVLFVLLSGCRAREARELGWKHLHLDGSAPEIILRASDTKTKTERSIDLKVSPSLVDLLGRWEIARGKESSFVFGGDSSITVNAIKAVRLRLVKTYGAPEFTWQQLRQTCDTYLVNAPAIYDAASIYRAAKRLGHSVVIAERHYAGLFSDISRDATTLEAAMGIEKESEEIVSEAGPAVKVASRRKAKGA
jgi:integrase